MGIEAFTGRYRFLSNFYPSPIEWRGKTYPTAEHLYQARKTAVDEWHERIRLARTPKEAKEFGQLAPMVNGWEEIKLPVMSSCLQLKFTGGGELRDALLDTGHQFLVEGNTWHDQFWGSCNCSRHTHVDGWNALGVLLMDTRLRLHNTERGRRAMSNLNKDEQSAPVTGDRREDCRDCHAE